MRIALLTCAFNEQRFIGPFLEHIPDWVDKKLVLVSERPWQGKPEKPDRTAEIAKAKAAEVVLGSWQTEALQRNFGLDYLGSYDWIIILDPDEFFDKANWQKLKKILESEPQADAFVVDHQLTYWKRSFVADPPRDYLQLIAVRPYVKFIENRVINSNYQVAPIYLHHFSWARTDDEVWNKISHYSHANNFDAKKWFNTVWKTWQPGIQNVHPTSPQTLHNLIPARLPDDLEKLNLWP